jgi:hypothetical protein
MCTQKAQCQLDQMICHDTVKPVLEVTIGKRKKWPFKTGDLLKEVQFI